MNIKNTIEKYAKILQENNIENPYKEVTILIKYILQKDDIWLHLNLNKEFLYEDKLKKLINKRKTHYPLEYIIKEVSFYKWDFFIEENVLIPRPETEILVEKTLSIAKSIKNPKIIEVGFGSGIISICLKKELPNSLITATDINKSAFKLAQKNAKKHNVNINFILTNLLDNIKLDFDILVSNPPYIESDYKLPKNVEFEPRNALFSGSDGLDIIKKLIDIFINSDIRYFLCEIGYNQKDKIISYINNRTKYKFYKDYSNFDRFFILSKE